MDNQNLPPDWSACNDAMNSDFSNPNIFWFSNDSILSDGQGYQNQNFEYDKINDMDPGDLQDYMIFNPSQQFQLNGPRAVDYSNSSYNPNSIIQNYEEFLKNPANLSINNNVVNQQSTGKSSIPNRRKSSPTTLNSQGRTKGKPPARTSATTNKSNAAISKGNVDHSHKVDDSGDENSSMNSNVDKDGDIPVNNSRSSSVEEERGGSDNDASKRKFTSKKVDVQNAREKNREHAKNTRMRKKNYIESLKESIKQLTDERERCDLERKASLSKLADQTLTRKKVLQQLFYFRSIGEADPMKWATILEEDFTMVMPITPYRSFPPSEVIEGQRHIKGIQGVILDTASFTLMIQSIATIHDDGENIAVQYYSGPNESVMAENTFMCKWHMTTVNAVRKGSRYEISKHGMAKAVFSPQNKLLFVELAFDVMSFMQQLRRSSGKLDFLVIPNTPALAMEESFEARMITEATKPHRITYINQSFVELFGYVPEQVIGYTCSILQGAETEQDKLNALMNNISRNLPCSATVTNYTIDKQKFKNWIRIYPLYVEGRVSHFLGVLERIADRYSMYRLPNTAAVSAAVAVTAAAAATASIPVGHIHHPMASLDVYKSSVDIGINVTDAQIQHHAALNPLNVAQNNVSASSSASRSSNATKGNRQKDGESMSSLSGRTNSSGGSSSSQRGASQGQVQSQSQSLPVSQSRPRTRGGKSHSTESSSSSAGSSGQKEGHHLTNPPPLPVKSGAGQHPYYSYPLTTAQVNDPMNSGESANSKKYNSSSRNSGGSRSGSATGSGSGSGSGQTSNESCTNFDGSDPSRSEGSESTKDDSFRDRGVSDRQMNDFRSEPGSRAGSFGDLLAGSGHSSSSLLLRNISTGSIASMNSDLKFSTNDINILSEEGFGDITFDEDLLYPLTD